MVNTVTRVRPGTGKVVAVWRRKPRAGVRRIARQEAKKMVLKQIETKNFYARLNAQAVPYGGTVFPLLFDPASGAYLVQGTAKNNFVGDTIRPQALYIRYSINTVATGGYFTVRVMVLQVKGGGTPSASNVLASVSNVMTPYSYVDPNYAETFNVLYSKIRVINMASVNNVIGSIRIPMKKLKPINFLGTTASSTTANNIFMVVYSDSSVGPNFGYQQRLAFKDA